MSYVSRNSTQKQRARRQITFGSKFGSKLFWKYARLKLKGVSKVNNDHKKQINNQLEAKHELRLKLAKIDLKKHGVSLSRDQEKRRKGDDIHNHWLLEIAAWEASLKRVKERWPSVSRR
jgi:phosphosulfolactate synthase (CoM biosynthesis protein A)